MIGKCPAAKQRGLISYILAKTEPNRTSFSSSVSRSRVHPRNSPFPEQTAHLEDVVRVLQVNPPLLTQLEVLRLLSKELHENQWS